MMIISPGVPPCKKSVQWCLACFLSKYKKKVWEKSPSSTQKENGSVRIFVQKLRVSVNIFSVCEVYNQCPLFVWRIATKYRVCAWESKCFRSCLQITCLSPLSTVVVDKSFPVLIFWQSFVKAAKVRRLLPDQESKESCRIDRAAGAIEQAESKCKSVAAEAWQKITTIST